MKRIIFGLFLTVLLAAANALGQSDIERPDPFTPVPDYRVPRLNDTLPRLERARTGPRSEPRVMNHGPLALADPDQANYAALLSQPNTGLIRLLPRVNPTSVFAYSGRRPEIRGDGAYYSFHFRAHEYGYGSDLELQAVGEFNASAGRLVELPPHYILSVGFAGADFGMLTNIGDVPLTDLSTIDARVADLLAYRAPHVESLARAEFQRFDRGVSIGGQIYKSTLPLEANATYLLRSINYDVSDVLVAFHVERQDGDGSVVIGWKLLKAFPMTQLTRNK